MARGPRTLSPVRTDLDEAREQIVRALDATTLDPRLSYADQVHDLLRHAIVRGRLLPGTTLSEAAIAAAVGVSRTPVREALRQLAQEELVQIYPQAGTVVAPVRMSLVQQGLFVRRAIECANLAELAAVISPEQIAELRELLAAQRDAIRSGRIEEFFRLDEAMHQRFLEFNGRGALWTLIQNAKLHLDRLRMLLLGYKAEHAERALHEHASIVERLAARDAAGLDAAIRDHLNAVTQHVVELRDRAPADYFID
ncbi:MAG TPA: GntR family transcriptional regulator [Candidatus Competibacteraceae bacterium]|nr:GntR family transcriptional regulator [Candidatus Competibacteraceae bacterium]